MKLEMDKERLKFTPECRNDTYWLGIISQKMTHESVWAPEYESIGSGMLEFKSLSIPKDVLINYLVNSRKDCQ